MSESTAAPILRVDHTGVILHPTGESWLVGDAQGAYPLTPPFLFRKPKTASIPAAKNLALHLIEAHRVMGVEEFSPTPEQWSLMQKLRWCVPLWGDPPGFQSDPPVVYLTHSGGGEPLRQVIARLQEMTGLTSRGFGSPLVRGGLLTTRLGQSNVQPVVFTGVTHHQQPLLRGMESQFRRSSLVWVTGDPDLIASLGSLKVSAEEFMQDSGTLLASGYNPFGLIKWWATRWYEREQFGIPLPYTL